VEAVAARLRAAQPAWAERTPAERALLLGRWADAIEADADAIAAALTVDTGRRAISRIEVTGAVGRSAAGRAADRTFSRGRTGREARTGGARDRDRDPARPLPRSSAASAPGISR
jgi:acyl-CoA reductase-like NAD-dependent aldehyde dehydrogenase